MTVCWPIAASSMVLALGLLCASPVRAQEEAPASEEFASESPVEETSYVPPADIGALSVPQAPAGAEATSSSLQGDAFSRLTQSMTFRDPFWPVDYKPKVVEPAKTSAVEIAAAAAPVVQVPKWDDAMKTIDVSGIMKTPAGFIANIGGQIVGQGETVTAVYDNRRYTWKIESISASGVSFQRLQVSP